MKIPIHRLVLTACTALCLSGAAILSWGADADSLWQQQLNPDPPIFSRLFQNPTNNNGYEEFVHAADLIKSVDDVDMGTQPGATLEFKRHLLSIPACSAALSLIREGLAKPVKSPRATFDQNTLFPELSLFRKLGKLLVTEQYVDFADGRVDAAAKDLHVGLSFGYRIQTDTFISGLVGIAISAIITHEFAAHLDQLSIYQCDDVLAFAKQMLEADTPGALILQKEKAQAQQMLDKRRNDPNGLLDIFSNFDFGSDPTGADALAFTSLKSSLGASPGSASSIIDAAEAKIGALYDQASANMRLPVSQRVPLAMDTSNAPGATLCRLVSVDPQRIVDRYATDQTRIRLLAIHMLIRRYQWDHNTLPGSLTELHAEDLVLDPFTGNTITYKRDSDRYTLTSAGPFKQDDTGKTTTERSPVKL